MKKHLIAVAVAAAVAAPAAMADTTLYGLAHVSIDAVKSDQAAGQDDSNVNVSSNSSRLGVKGTEKISSNLSAIYQFETLVNVSSNAGTSSGLFGEARNTFVGLTGGWGTALVGKHDTPMKLVGRKYDLFGDQIGDSRNLIGVGGAGWDLRPNNVVAYVTPAMAGIQATLAYVTDHDIAGNTPNYDNNKFDAYSLSATYTHKIFDLGAAYERHNIDAAGQNNESAYRLGAGVNFAGVRVNALYQKASDLGFTAGKDQSVWGAGASYTFGNNVVKAQYYKANDISGTTDTGANMFAVGYDYKLSKQTTLYAAYAKTDNDAATTAYNVSKAGHGDYMSVGVAGGNASAFSVGVMHKF
ncbi:porin [Thiofaba sp. EF100]|uniref:porin n=1 Tax=Thiofaba sp. EF100 TaxID=3121274 RepID=UPI0032214648